MCVCAGVVAGAGAGAGVYVRVGGGLQLFCCFLCSRSLLFIRYVGIGHGASTRT